MEAEEIGRNWFIGTSEGVGLEDHIKANRAGKMGSKSSNFERTYFLNDPQLKCFHISSRKSHKILNKLLRIKNWSEGTFPKDSLYPG